MRECRPNRCRSPKIEQNRSVSNGYNPGRVASPAQITGLLRAWSDGDNNAFEALVPLVEAELRRLARVYMARERRDHTLQATALVNEAFVRLIGRRTCGGRIARIFSASPHA